MRAREIAARLGPHFKDTDIIRLAAHHGMAFVTALDVNRAHYFRRKLGPVKQCAIWSPTDARSRMLPFGTIACRIAAALEHGFALLEAAHPSAPENPYVPRS